MSKPRTSKPRRRPRSQVLEVRVMSPRIAWFSFLTFAGSVAKLALILAAVAGIGWGVWQGIQRAFYKNPDFRLQVIDLNPNPAIDEVGLAEATGIDLTASLFDIDVDEVTAKLKALPEIADARAERHLPGKLVVRVTPRTPRAWISCPQAGLSETRRAGAMLVDFGSIAYPCPALQLESAMNLPVIKLPLSESHPIVAGQHAGHLELAHCFRLLDAACGIDPEAIHWIESVNQTNEWSLLLVTREGTSATFGLGDHDRQIRSLRAAMDHSSQKGYAIDTINLIPKHNIPITLRNEAAAPKALPVSEPSGVEIREDRRSRDLKALLNSN
ncbi:MAG: FtsQ-type POTRA domain-containing protein [Verrucomicrobiota bacterium]